MAERRVTQSLVESDHLDDSSQRVTQVLVEVDVNELLVYTSGVAMPEYEGDARGVPIPGDRAAWDVVDYAARHARDLKDDEPIHHVPEGDAVGDAPVWDGDKWVSTGVATQAELDAHEGQANPHGTDVGDLADVDVTTTPPNDGDAIVWDDAESEWVPADLVEQATFDDHSARHETGGADEISVAGLSGVLADKQDADKIQGRDVAADAPNDGDVLLWNNTTSQWEPQTVSTSGWEPLTNGNAASPEIVFADGDVVMVEMEA